MSSVTSSIATGLTALLVCAGCRNDAERADRPAAVAVLPTPLAGAAAPSRPRNPVTDEPRRVEFAPAPQESLPSGTLMVMERNGDLQLWQIDAGRFDCAVTIKAGAVDARFTAGGRAVVVGDDSGAVSLWRADGMPLWRRQTGATSVRAVEVLGDLLVSGDDRGHILTWSPDGGLRSRLESAHAGAVLSLALAPDGNTLVSEGIDTLLRGWRVDPAAGALTALRSYREPSERFRKMLPNLIRWDVQWGWDRSVDFAPDGRSFIAAGFAGSLQWWGVGGELLRTIGDAHDGHHVRSVAFSPDGRYFASGGYDKTVRLWSTSSEESPRIIRGHLRAVSSVAFDNGGQRLVSTGIDGTVRLWNLAGEELGTLPRRRPPSAQRGPIRK